MSETFTPGPWAVDIDLREGGVDQILDANDMTICFMAYSGVRDNDSANANLIAAAPTLFEALKKARARIIELQDFLRWQDKLPSEQRRIEPEWLGTLIDSALAHARGETA